jgi:hypothetical protein
MTFIIAIFLIACKKKENEDTITTFTIDKVIGVSQKGPFLNGSSITAFELNGNFTQTGKSFNTQILDNLGSFELSNMTMLTHYTKLKADGFYFNEVKNSNSLSSISLYAISDLSDKSTVNVNLLSTLEVSRVEYLINNGSTFTDAKHQAQQEILNMFFINKPTMSESELLNISIDGDDNAILLAISLILQGYRTEAELSQLLGDISTDIRTDGILNSSTLGSSLINDAKLLDTVQIRSNLESKYTLLGINTTIPHFEYYFKQFLDSCNYTFTNYITFPDNGLYGINILNSHDSIFSSTGNYSFCANIPAGTHLKIRFSNPIIGYEQATSNGWIDTGAPTEIILENYQSGIIDLRIGFSNMNFSGTILFYENYSTTPTRTKNIYLQ